MLTECAKLKRFRKKKNKRGIGNFGIKKSVIERRPVAIGVEARRVLIRLLASFVMSQNLYCATLKVWRKDECLYVVLVVPHGCWWAIFDFV